MRNNKFLIIAAVAFIFIAMGCEKTLDTEGISRVTEYPVFDLSGEALVIHQQGTSFTDPGASASSNGADVPVDVIVTGRFTGYSGTTVNTDVPDEYTISYSAENADGLAGSAERIVVVTNTGDMTTSIEGAYSCLTTRSGDTYSPVIILIWATGTPGVFEISHAYGGRYSDGLAYGDGYRFSGATITVNDMATNDFTISAGVSELLGRTAQMSSFVVNSATKTITFGSTQNVGYPVTCVMTQVSP